MKKRSPNAMTVEIVETLTLTELCQFCHVQPHWVVGLVDQGVLDPIGDTTPGWRFAAPSVARARKARRLARDLGLNMAGIALVLDLIEERDALARRLVQYYDAEIQL